MTSSALKFQFLIGGVSPTAMMMNLHLKNFEVSLDLRESVNMTLYNCREDFALTGMSFFLEFAEYP